MLNEASLLTTLYINVINSNMQEENRIAREVVDAALKTAPTLRSGGL